MTVKIILRLQCVSICISYGTLYNNFLVILAIVNIYFFFENSLNEYINQMI